MGKNRNAYNISEEISEEERPLVIPRRRWDII
jgi:hypothetical protein